MTDISLFSWGHKGQSLIDKNYETRQGGGRRPNYDDSFDEGRRPPPPRGRGMDSRGPRRDPRELDYRREQLMREMDGEYSL